MGSPLETLVPYSDDFVNQVAIEIDGQRHSEVEPGPHTGGIAADRFRQILAELREILDVLAHYREWLVIEAADHPDVVVSGHAAADAASQAHRPRYGHLPVDSAECG